MTIFDHGYSSIDFRPVPPLARLWPLVRAEFGRIFRTRRSQLVFTLCVAYVVVLLVLVWANLGTGSDRWREVSRISPKSSPFRREFYMVYSTDWGFLAFVLLTSLVGVRSIAGDRAANALEILWTRGVSPWGYFLGKWLGSALLLAAVYVAGPVVVWLTGLLGAPDLAFARQTAGFMPAVVLALGLKCLILSFLAVAFSALASSPNVVTVLWLLLVLASEGVARLLTELSRIAARGDPERVSDAAPWFKAISPWDAMVRIEEGLVGIARVSDYPVWIAWTWLLGLCAVLLLALRRRLRTTEAIG